MCPSITGSRTNQLVLFDSAGKSLGVKNGGCNFLKIGAGCALEGNSDITIGKYVVKHPNAYFGACTYENGEATITGTFEDGDVTETYSLQCSAGPADCGVDGNGFPVLGGENYGVMGNRVE